MKIFGFEINRARREEKLSSFETVLRLLAAGSNNPSSTWVTPENCEQSPTVKAIITAVSNRLAVTPVHVYQKKTINGRESKEPLPDHSVAKLLSYPNGYQTRANFFADMASTLLRWGNFVAYKGQGNSGPIRFLTPWNPGSVDCRQDDKTYALTYRYNGAEIPPRKILHIRGTAKDFYWGDSPVRQVADTIALEIVAERFGLSFFDNGAVPLVVFNLANGGASPFKTKEEADQFIRDFQEAFGGRKKHSALVLPKGIEAKTPIAIENDKAQMIETRRYQRTVIAGAFGVPPQYVGDLERATFNNVEQQTIQFTADVIYPVVQYIEAALERDLLTEEDWRARRVIRFNLDSTLRADFKSRQEGLQIQRNNGVLSPNEWREIEGKNPLPDDKGGEEYLRPANMVVAGEEPAEPAPVSADKPASAADDELRKAIARAKELLGK